MTVRSCDIMIVAGEPSGDAHAARLVTSLKGASDTQLNFFGSAGPGMRAAGVEPTVAADELSVVGLAEIGRALPMFMRAMRRLKREAASRQPEVAILVDFPDFNLRLARSLKTRGIKVVYYISPQLWAWRRHRVSAIRKYVDLLITILPFEKHWYAAHGVDHVEYVGNPLATEVHAARTRDEFCRDYGLRTKDPIFSLLPGSRQKEIVRILPVMLRAAARVRERQPGCQFVVPLADDRHLGAVRSSIERAGVEVLVVTSEAYNALAASDVAAVTSGTATLETGILGTPMVVVYKTSAVNYNLLEPMIDVPHYGLINLIAGKRIATELIQKDLTPERLSRELLTLLEPKANAAMRTQLAAAVANLGKGGASKRAAALILQLIHRSDL